MQKESFILYNSFYEPIKALKNEQLGKLLRAIFNYTINGEITQDNEILVAFMFIKNQIDIDTNKWQEEKTKRSEAGKKGMASRWNNNDNSVITNNNKNNNVINAITNITDNVNDNVYVNDNDNVINKKKILKEKEKKSYGEFNNVLLTDEEYAKLEKSNLLTYIDILSSYIASKGKKYRSHYATILTWNRNDNKKQEEPKYLSYKERKKLEEDKMWEEYLKGDNNG